MSESLNPSESPDRADGSMDYLPRMPPRQCSGILSAIQATKCANGTCRQGEAAAFGSRPALPSTLAQVEFVKLGPREGEKLRLVLTHLASESRSHWRAPYLCERALRDRGESHREQHPPGSLPDKRGVDRFVIEQVDRRRQRRP